MLYWYFRYAYWRYGDDAVAPETKCPPDTVQDFLYHWVYDEKNRYQRKFVPIRSILSFVDEINYIQSLVEDNGLALDAVVKPMIEQNALPPILFHIGKLDQTVGN